VGIEQYFGELMLEPLCYELGYIANLTDEQILVAIWTSSRRYKELDNRRHGFGNVFDPDKAEEEEQRIQFWSLGRMLGTPEQDIQYLWDHRNDDSKVIPTMTIPRKGLMKPE
jgi:hypothetical protein